MLNVKDTETLLKEAKSTIVELHQTPLSIGQQVSYFEVLYKDITQLSINIGKDLEKLKKAKKALQEVAEILDYPGTTTEEESIKEIVTTCLKAIV